MIFFVIGSPAKKTTVSDYHPLQPIQCMKSEGKEMALLRRFRMDDKSYLLAVETRKLTTHTLPDRSYDIHPCKKNTRYFRLLNFSSRTPYPLQNDGITHGEKGLYLTTDLCPSSQQGFEKALYEAIIRHFSHPVPVTLFLTKRWIEKHSPAFETLRQWDANGSLAITWGNHTAWHHYHPGRPLKENFVLSTEENLTEDVLILEKTLLKRGITPAVFFRFPGLVSDEKSVETVKQLGLIVIGADAWLAKGQTPKEGSIILLHGNRNEPEGVDRFLRMLDNGEIGNLQSLTEIDVGVSSE